MFRRNLTLALLLTLMFGATAVVLGRKHNPDDDIPPRHELAAPTTPSAWPDLGDRRVLIVSIDGLRPDLLLRADTPHLHALLKQSAFSMWAQTTAVAITLPSHASMLTGVIPGKHGIDYNDDMPATDPIYPRWPTLFELAKERKLTTALVSGKSKFSALAKPGSVDYLWLADEGDKPIDSTVGDQAVAMIHQHQPQVLFVHFPKVDTVGHKEGWSSPAQMQAIHAADDEVGRLLQALDEEHLRAATLVIVTADHGGTGRKHGADDSRSRHIPWIVSAPGVNAGLDLTIYPRLNVRTEDTFATACWYLGLPLYEDLDGRAVTEAFTPFQLPPRYD